MTQKAIIIRTQGTSSDPNLDKLSAAELNSELKDGWRFVSATPFGVGSAAGGENKGRHSAAAVLVIIEK
jgi:hypothetical protein